MTGLTNTDPRIDRLPYPIAVPWSRLHDAVREGRNEFKTFERLEQVVEAMLRTLALVGVSAYLERGPLRDDIDSALRAQIVGKPLLLSGWLNMLDQILQPFRTAPDAFPLPDLVRFWLQRAGSPSRAAETVRQFLAVRNRARHGGLGEAERLRVVGDFAARFDSVLGDLSFFDEYELLVPLRATPSERGRFQVHEIVPCHGCALRPEPGELSVRAPLSEGDEISLVQRATREELFRLFPLLLPRLGEGPEFDDLLTYERHQRRGGAQRAVSLVHYVGVRSAERRQLRRDSEMAHVVAAFGERLARWISDSQTEDEPLRDDPRFVGMSEAVDDAARGFVGREPAIAEIEGRAVSATGSLLIVAGPPGAGKTSLLAKVARDLAAAAVHLTGTSAGRDDPRLIARALLAQTLLRYELRCPVPEEFGDARKRFHELLREVGVDGDPVVVVIDALDELRPGADGNVELGLVPDPVPPGVCMVVSARPGDVVERLRKHPQAKIVELSPMGDGDLGAIARTLLPEAPEAVLAEACAEAEGNPLFLRLLLLNPGDALPRTVEAACSMAVERAAREHGAMVERALGLLALTRSGLARRDLARLLNTTPFVVGRLLQTLRPLLFEDAGRFRLFHGRIRQWARDEFCDEATSRALHAAIAGVLDEGARCGREDAYHDLATHLEAAGKTESLRALLDGDYLVGKVRALGSPQAAREDLVRGVSAVGSDLVAAARYGLTAALLTRGATTLVREGVATLIARHVDPRLAASLARTVPDPDEGERALASIAEQAALVDQLFALALLAEIRDPVRRATAEARVRGSQRPAAESSLNGDGTGNQDEFSAWITAALRAPPRSGVELVRRAARRALSRADRALRVWTLAAAAGGSSPACRAMAERALAEAKLADTDAIREALVVVAIAAVGRFNRARARTECRALARAAVRVRARTAIGDLSEALGEAEGIEDLSERVAAEAHVLVRWSAKDPAFALERCREFPKGVDRDRVLVAITETPGGGEAAVKAAELLEDPGLRAGAMVRVGRSQAAETLAELVEDPAARVALWERMAEAAWSIGDKDRAARYRQLADATRRERLRAPGARAASLLEAAAIGERGDLESVRQQLLEAAQLELDFDVRRETLLRRARILLLAPTLDGALESVRLSVPFGDAFADLFPDLVSTLSQSAKGEASTVPDRIVEALAWSEHTACVLLCAGLGGEAAVTVSPPAQLSEQVIASLRGAVWTPPAERIGRVPGEADLLSRKLHGGTIVAREVDRLVEVHLAAGRRDAAVGALVRWAALAEQRGEPAVAQATRRRAAGIIANDPRVSLPPPSDAAAPMPPRPPSEQGAPRLPLNRDFASVPPLVEPFGRREGLVSPLMIAKSPPTMNGFPSSPQSELQYLVPSPASPPSPPSVPRPTVGGDREGNNRDYWHRPQSKDDDVLFSLRSLFNLEADRVAEEEAARLRAETVECDRTEQARRREEEVRLAEDRAAEERRVVDAPTQHEEADRSRRALEEGALRIRLEIERSERERQLQLLSEHQARLANINAEKRKRAAAVLVKVVAVIVAVVVFLLVNLLR